VIWSGGATPGRGRVRRGAVAVLAAAGSLVTVPALTATAGAAVPGAATPPAPTTSTTTTGTTPQDAAVVAQASKDVSAPLPALPAVDRQYTNGVDPAVLLTKAFALLQAGTHTASLNENLSQLQATMEADNVKATQAKAAAAKADAEAARDQKQAQELTGNAQRLAGALRDATLTLYMNGRPDILPVLKRAANSDAVVDAIIGEQVALSPDGLLAAQKRAAGAARAAAAQATADKGTADTKAQQAVAAQQAVTAEVATMQDELASVKAPDATTLESESSTLTQQAGQNLTGSGGLQFTPKQPIPPPVTTTEAALVWAFSELGKPYVWGGTGPDVFDCSGLTQWSWGHAGVSIPRVAIDQYNYTIPVPLSQLRPGDLVFFGTDVHHVGMYIGGGLMINAPYTGTVVQISSMWWSDLIGFGRVHSPGVPVPAHSTANGSPANVVSTAGAVPSQAGSNPATITKPPTTTTTGPASPGPAPAAPAPTSPTTVPAGPAPTAPPQSPTTTTTTTPSSTTTAPLLP
jgi:cell wall-associated NlpC family hydrolase